MGWKCRNGKIEGLRVITPFFTEDQRGYFLKNMEKDIFSGFGIEMDIYEEFETYSKKNVIRGLHFQTQNPQGKLVRAVKGSIMDVAVDLREGSSTFGRWESVMLSDENHEAFWIPAGFAHGFEVISEDALVSYKCVGKFLSEYDTGIKWDDPDIGIKWMAKEPVLSAKDNQLMSLKEFVANYHGLKDGAVNREGGVKYNLLFPMVAA